MLRKQLLVLLLLFLVVVFVLWIFYDVFSLFFHKRTFSFQFAVHKPYDTIKNKKGKPSIFLYKKS